jgi:hypothetical protein
MIWATQKPFFQYPLLWKEDDKGNKRRRNVNKDSGRGIPRKAVDSLPAILYMRRFLLGGKMKKEIESSLCQLCGRHKRRDTFHVWAS